MTQAARPHICSDEQQRRQRGKQEQPRDCIQSHVSRPDCFYLPHFQSILNCEDMLLIKAMSGRKTLSASQATIRPIVIASSGTTAAWSSACARLKRVA